jgi:hypothetical protein
MPANVPDMGAISNLGGQFTHNIFASGQKKLNHISNNLAEQHVHNVKTTQANRDRFAASAAQGVQKGRTAFVKGQQQQANTQAKSAASAAKAHAAGVKSGRVAPAQGAAPRVFAMGGRPTQFKQPTAGGSVSTTSVKAPSLTPGFSSPTPTHTPVQAKPIPSTSFSSQLSPQKPLQGPQGSATASFSHGSTPSTPSPVAGSLASSQFSGHIHPAGSSTTPLPNLTASQPKPNTFTTGSRNAKPGGIAARGSQLESWAMGKQAQVRAQRGTGN